MSSTIWRYPLPNYEYLLSVFGTPHTIENQQERQEVDALLRCCARTPQDYFKLLEDKHYFWSENRQNCVAYRSFARAAVVLGDPLGPDDGLPAVVAGFLQHCKKHLRTLVIVAAEERFLPVYQSLGLHTIKIGENALIDLDCFARETLSSSAGKNLRRALRKLEEKDAYCLRHYAPPHDEKLLDDLEAISDEWLTLPGHHEHGFVEGYFSRPYLQRFGVYVVENEQQHRIAFVTTIPDYVPRTTGSDLMRHRKDMPNATMDYLFTSLLLQLHDSGCQRFDLGLALLSNVGETPGASAVEHILHQVYANPRFNRLFSFQGLRQFKEKYQPEWQPRFLVYEGSALNLIRDGLAISKVTSHTDHKNS